MCCMYQVLIVLLGIILSCDSKAFDWGNLKNQYATRDDDITAQDVAMPGVIPDSVRALNFHINLLCLGQRIC